MSTRAGTQPYTQTRTTSYRVLGTENVTVPAGTFTAYLVEAETAENTFDIEPQKHWYAPDACTIVKTVSIQSGGYSDTFELLSYRCASTQGAAGEGDAKPIPASAIAPLAALVGAAALVAVALAIRQKP